MLTRQQISHYQTFGFLTLPELLAPEEVETLQDEFERGLEATTHCNRCTQSSPFTQWSNLKPETCFTGGLLEDPRFAEVAEELYGEDVIGLFVNSNLRAADTPWHVDSVSPDAHGVKFTTYLQPLDGSNGALRIIPGSHRSPYHEEVERFLKQPDVAPSEVPVQVCETLPGGVIAFDHQLYHAAWGASDKRRQLTICYLQAPKSTEELRAAREAGQAVLEIYRRVQAPPPHHHPDWIANPQDNPRRRRSIHWLSEWGVLESEKFIKRDQEA